MELQIRILSMKEYILGGLIFFSNSFSAENLETALKKISLSASLKTSLTLSDDQKISEKKYAFLQKTLPILKEYHASTQEGKELFVSALLHNPSPIPFWDVIFIMDYLHYHPNKEHQNVQESAKLIPLYATHLLHSKENLQRLESDKEREIMILPTDKLVADLAKELNKRNFDHYYLGTVSLEQRKKYRVLLDNFLFKNLPESEAMNVQVLSRLNSFQAYQRRSAEGLFKIKELKKTKE